MGRRAGIPTLLLLAAASFISILHLPPFVSSASPAPKIGPYSSTTAGRPQKLTKLVTGFLKKNWFGVAVDVLQFVVPMLSSGNDAGDQPPPPPPGDNADDQPPASPPGDAADLQLPPLPTGNSSDGQRQGIRAAQNAGLYYVDLFVGNPPQKILGVMDISTQFVRMQCGCTACSPSPPASAFQYSASSTFSYPVCSSNFCQWLLPRSCSANIVNEPCNYYTYDGQHFTPVGYTVTDTFTFGNTPVRSMVFGCTGDYSGPPGVIGFGRGPLSLVSQLRLSSFSYLMPPQDSDRGIQIQFDEVAMAQAGASRSRNSTTPLQTSSLYPYSYYVSLIGIQVDGKYLGGIPAGTFDLQKDGSGGVVLSTTVPVTFLEQDAYNALKQALVSKIPVRPVDTTSGRAGSGSLDLCYMARSMEGVNVPRLTLVFSGGAALDLNPENYLFRFNDDGQSDLVCLTVLPSKGASLLGSLMQMGTKMIYDLAGEQLTFVTQNKPSHVFVSPEAPSPTSRSPNTSQAPHASYAAWLATIVPAAAVWTLLL